MVDGKTPSNAPPLDLQETSTSEARYGTLTQYREPYLQRAYECAEMTIPKLLPRNGHNSTTKLPIPFQSSGARGVNNLKSKLLMALFPPNTPFFKLKMDQKVIAEVEAKYGDGSAEAKNISTEFDKAFSKIERMTVEEMEGAADRVALGEALAHLIVTGNALLHHSKEGLRVFRLDQYVTRRDPAGNLLEIIVREAVDPITLPQVLQAFVRNHPKYGGKGTVYLFTHVIRRDTNWEVVQEVCGVKIEKTRGTYPLDSVPWVALRQDRIDGEDYGRSYVEDYLGDLISLENLTAAIVQGSAAAAKVLFLVKPNSSTKVKVLAQTPNGGFGSGNAEDVTVLRLDKAQDFQTAKLLRDDFVQQLSYAFLMNTAIQRDAERVTAEEVRYMAQELETALGGFYSIMAVELQLPFVRVKLAQLQRQGKMPKLPKGAVKPTIVTGLEALGRGNDADKLTRYVKLAFETLTPQIAIRYINPTEVLDRLAISLGIDTKNLLNSEEKIAQQEQQAQQQALIEKLGPQAISQMGGITKEAMTQQGDAAAAAAAAQPGGEQ